VASALEQFLRGEAEQWIERREPAHPAQPLTTVRPDSTRRIRMYGWYRPPPTDSPPDYELVPLGPESHEIRHAAVNTLTNVFSDVDYTRHLFGGTAGMMSGILAIGYALSLEDPLVKTAILGAGGAAIVAGAVAVTVAGMAFAAYAGVNEGPMNAPLPPELEASQRSRDARVRADRHASAWRSRSALCSGVRSR
jgi:hypothetical protein